MIFSVLLTLKPDCSTFQVFGAYSQLQSAGFSLLGTNNNQAFSVEGFALQRREGGHVAGVAVVGRHNFSGSLQRESQRRTGIWEGVALGIADFNAYKG